MSAASEVVLGVGISDELLDALAERLEGRVNSKRRFTTAALADHLGVTPRYVRGFSERGRARDRVGKSMLWDIREVDARLASR